MPTVSVIIVSDQDVLATERALRSVLAQTFADLECLVVHKGQNPEIIAMLERIDDARVRSCCLPPGHGFLQKAAMAAEQTSGEWLAWMREQDEWMIGKLSQQLALFQASATERPGFLGGGVVVLPTRKLPVYLHWNEEDPANQGTAKAWVPPELVMGSWLIHRDLLKRLGEISGLSYQQLADQLANHAQGRGVDEPVLLCHLPDDKAGVTQSARDRQAVVQVREDDPLISVVLPTFNRKDMLLRSAASVLAQTYPKLELIVVDDCSTEDIPAVVASLNDQRVRCIRRQVNGGPSAARNTGIQAARGTLIAFQDSDDEWALDKLERQLAAMHSTPRASGCIGTMLRVVDGGFYIMRHRNAPDGSGISIDQIVNKPVAYTQTWLVPRQALLETPGFDDGLSIWEDWDLLLTLSQGLRFVSAPDAVAISQRYEDSVTQSKAAFIESIHCILVKHEQLLSSMPETRSQLFYELAHRLFDAGLLGQSRRYFLFAARSHPRHFKAWIYWVLCMLRLRGLIRVLRGSWRRLRGRESQR